MFDEFPFIPVVVFHCFSLRYFTKESEEGLVLMGFHVVLNTQVTGEPVFLSFLSVGPFEHMMEVKGFGPSADKAFSFRLYY